jgi:hypothetical protein
MIPLRLEGFFVSLVWLYGHTLPPGRKQLTVKRSLYNLSTNIHIIFPDSTNRQKTFSDEWRCRGSPWRITSDIQTELQLTPSHGAEGTF